MFALQDWALNGSRDHVYGELFSPHLLRLPPLLTLFLQPYSIHAFRPNCRALADGFNPLTLLEEFASRFLFFFYVPLGDFFPPTSRY